MIDLNISDAQRYDNVFVGDDMVASYDNNTGEFVVYDPQSDSEEPAFIVQTNGGNQ